MRSTWLVSTRLPATAQRIHALLGGEEPAQDLGADTTFVATSAEKVAVIIDSADSVQFDMKQWIDGKLAHHCDTSVFLSPASRKGSPCDCPPSIADLKARAATEGGPIPDIRIQFRLAVAPELGSFEYRTSGWALLTDHVFNLGTLRRDLANARGPAVCSLEIELARYTTKLGQDVGFRRVRLRPIEASESPSGTRTRFRTNCLSTPDPPH